MTWQERRGWDSNPQGLLAPTVFETASSSGRIPSDGPERTRRRARGSPMADEFTLTARWVFPVTSPPLERGLVTVVGDRIAAVEPHGSRAADIDLGNTALTPGFVNAHTHLDLTGARGQTPPTSDFVGWLRKVIAYRRERTTEQVAEDVQAGIAESLRSGTTLVGRHFPRCVDVGGADDVAGSSRCV